MNSFKYIVILSILSSCSKYLYKSNDIKVRSKIENQYLYFNGFFKDSMSNDQSFMKTLHGRKFVFDSFKNIQNLKIELKSISGKVLLVKLYEDSTVKDSVYIKGKFKDSSFIFKTKRNIVMLFPLFWDYNILKYKFVFDGNKNICLKEYGESYVFITIAPIMAANGRFTYKLVSVS